MPILTRKESQERQQWVLRFFADGFARGEDPTGEEAQKALTSGRLGGEKNQPPMGNGMLYKLKAKAKAQSARANVSVPPAPAGVALRDKQIQALRDRAQDIQKALNENPSSVLEVRITRDGIFVTPMRPTELKLG